MDDASDSHSAATQMQLNEDETFDDDDTQNFDDHYTASTYFGSGNSDGGDDDNAEMSGTGRAWEPGLEDWYKRKSMMILDQDLAADQSEYEVNHHLELGCGSNYPADESSTALLSSTKAPTITNPFQNFDADEPRRGAMSLQQPLAAETPAVGANVPDFEAARFRAQVESVRQQMIDAENETRIMVAEKRRHQEEQDYDGVIDDNTDDGSDIDSGGSGAGAGSDTDEMMDDIVKDVEDLVGAASRFSSPLPNANEELSILQLLNTENQLLSPVKPSSDKKNACGACLNTFVAEQLIKIACGCCYCQDCLNACFRTGLANRGSFPPKCCGQEIAAHVITKHLSPDLSERYEAVQEEFGATDPTHCASITCGNFIQEANVRDGFGICLKCREKTCTECKNLQAAHEQLGGSCPENVVASECKDLIQEKQLSRCPGCHYVVEKIDGCDFMRCVYLLIHSSRPDLTRELTNTQLPLWARLLLQLRPGVRG